MNFLIVVAVAVAVVVVVVVVFVLVLVAVEARLDSPPPYGSVRINHSLSNKLRS